MPQWFWGVIVSILMFIAGPSVSAILFKMANEWEFGDIFGPMPTLLKVFGIIFWVVDWGAILAVIGLGIYKLAKRF